MTRRAHTRVEVERKLRERQFDAREIEETIARAKELKLMEDDAAIADRYAKSLAERRDATPVWTRQKLEQRGIVGDVAREAVARAFDGWDERAAAKALLGTETHAGRASRKLKRRGFSTETIMAVVRTLGRDED